MTAKSLSAMSLAIVRVAILVTTLVITSCVNTIDEENPQPDPGDNLPTAQARITTRTGANGIAPVYPVRIYAFNTAGKCAAIQTIDNDETDIGLSLPAGTYTIYALAGATDTRYTLPTAETITPTTTLQPKATDGLHDELQTAHATITLASEETQDLTLTVERCIAGVTVQVINLPETITACSITLQPLKPGVNIDGTYTTDTPGAATINLIDKGNRTWATNNRQFILPATENTTVTISLTTADETKHHSYNSTITIEAGNKVNIEATYQAGALQVAGTVTGADWKGNQSINFDFGEADNPHEPTPETPGDFNAAPGDIYKGCYVLSVTPTEALLLAPDEKNFTGSTQNPLADQINAYLATYTNQAGSEWQLPTTQQATLICDNFFNINSKVSYKMSVTETYIYLDSKGVMRWFELYERPTGTTNKAAETAAYSIRPVKTIKI